MAKARHPALWCDVVRAAARSAIFLSVMLLAGWSTCRAWAGENQIEVLAHRDFPKMRWTECERNLLKHVPTGEVAYCGPRRNTEKDTAPQDTGKKRMPFDVDAELIRWLCVNPAAIKLVDPRGIRLHAARVVGQLDLSFATVVFPLTFQKSRFAADINLVYSQLLTFSLKGSQTRGIAANNMTVRGDVQLLDGFSALGEVNLADANISGDLICSGGTFKTPGKGRYALNAANLRAVSVSLNKGFSSDGEVNLDQAILSGELDCGGGKFKNPGSDALRADGLQAVSVSLNEGFSSDGGVRIPDVNLSGVLDCGGGKFKNPGKDKYALAADRILAAGVDLNNGFSAEGAVRLPEARLSGELDCSSGKFKNAGNYALWADDLKASFVRLSDGFSAEGEVRLANANLSSTLNCSGGKFRNLGIGKYALVADRLRATGVYLDNGFSGEGEVRLGEANLFGELSCMNGKFKNRGYPALDARRLKATSVSLNYGFSSEGEVDLSDATVDSDLSCEGGTFKNPGETALMAEGLKAGVVKFRYAFTAIGLLDFVGSYVGTFVWTNLTQPPAAELVLVLNHATVGSLFDDKESWPRQGNLRLDGFVYSEIGDPLIGDGPIDAPNRLSWLNLQRPKANQSFDFEPQPFEQLAKVLRENGDEAGAKSVLIAMENARWWHGKVGFWERCWRGILWLAIGYGYDMWRALWFIGGFVAVGTFLFFWGYRSEAITQTDAEKPENFRPFNPFVYSLETFLPLVDLGQAKHWAPDPGLRKPRPHVPLAPFKPLSKYQHQFGLAFGKHLRWYLWFHILAGWFFTSMLIAGITGLVQKG